MEGDFGFVYRHHPYSIPPDVSLSFFQTEIGRLNPKPGFANPLTSQHRYPNERNISQNWHHRTHHLDNVFPPYYDLGTWKIPMAGPTHPPERLLGFNRSGGNATPFDARVSRPPVRFHPNHLAAREDGPGDLTGDETGENTEELDALLGSDDDFSDEDDEMSTGRSPVERGPCDLPAGEIDGFVGPAAKRRRTGDQSSLWGEGSRREKVGQALRALRRVVPGGRGKDGITVIDEAIEYLISLKVEMEAPGLDPL